MFLQCRMSVTPTSMAVAPNGSAIVTGSYSGALDLTQLIPSSTAADAFVTSISP